MNIEELEDALMSIVRDRMNPEGHTFGWYIEVFPEEEFILLVPYNCQLGIKTFTFEGFKRATKNMRDRELTNRQTVQEFIDENLD